VGLAASLMVSNSPFCWIFSGIVNLRVFSPPVPFAVSGCGSFPGSGAVAGPRGSGGGGCGCSRKAQEPDEGAGSLEPLGAPWEGAVEPRPVLGGAEPALHPLTPPLRATPTWPQALGGPGVPLPPVGHEDHPAYFPTGLPR